MLTWHKFGFVQEQQQYYYKQVIQFLLTTTTTTNTIIKYKSKSTAAICLEFLLKFINYVDNESQFLFKNLFCYVLNICTKFFAINPAYSLNQNYQLGVLLSHILHGKGSTLTFLEEFQLKFCATNPTAKAQRKNWPWIVQKMSGDIWCIPIGTSKSDFFG